MLAIAGSMISIYGTCKNNLWHDHHGAMVVWMYSNIILLVWAAGNCLGYWDGGLSAGALAIMYAVFSITNLYGLNPNVS